MNQTVEKSFQGRLSPQEHFAQACAIAGMSVPATEEEGRQLAERCIEGARVKAEKFAKASLSAVTQSAALDRTAQLCLFQNWNALTSFAQRFAAMSPAQRVENTFNSRLLAAAWVLQPEHEDIPQVRFILGAQRDLLADQRHPEYAEGVIRRVMFASYKRVGAERLGYSAEELTELLVHDIGWTPARFILSMLAKVPVIEGKRAGWPPLAGITTGQLLEMRLANTDTTVGFGYCGWEHGVAMMQPALTAWASMPVGWFDEDLAEEVKRKRLVQTADTRIACREALEGVLQPISEQSVLHALMRQEGVDGFFGNLYGGTPEHIEDVDLPRLFLRHPANSRYRLKRLAFRQSLHGYQFSMWRQAHCYESDSKAGTFHNVEAVLHNERDELVAKVCLCLSNFQDDCGLEEFVWHMDGPNRSDLLELASAVVKDAVAGEFVTESWRRLLFICDWEVRKQDRGQGLGVMLLKHALKTAFRGLPGPQCVAVSLEPLQTVCPPLLGGACERLPDFDEPRKALRRHWDTKVVDAGLLPTTVEHILMVPYAPLFHARDHRFELLGLGELRAMAGRYDSREDWDFDDDVGDEEDF